MDELIWDEQGLNPANNMAASLSTFQNRIKYSAAAHAAPRQQMTLKAISISLYLEAYSVKEGGGFIILLLLLFVC